MTRQSERAVEAGADPLPPLTRKESSVVERFTFLLLIGALGQCFMILGTVGVWHEHSFAVGMMAAGFGALLMALTISLPAAPAIFLGRTLRVVRAVAMDGPFAALMVCSVAAFCFRYVSDPNAWCWRTSFQAASIGLQTVIGLSLLHLLRERARLSRQAAG